MQIPRQRTEPTYFFCRARVIRPVLGHMTTLGLVSWTRGPLFSHLVAKKRQGQDRSCRRGYEKRCFGPPGSLTAFSEQGRLPYMSSFALAWWPNRRVKILTREKVQD